MHQSLDILLVALILRVRSCLGGFLSLLLPSHHQSAYSSRDFFFFGVLCFVPNGKFKSTDSSADPRAPRRADTRKD